MPMDPTLLSAVEEHACVEAGNAIAYLNAYSILRATGWMGFSKKMKNEVDDEMGHAQNFAKLAAKYDNVVTIDPDYPEAPAATDPIALAQFASDLEAATEASMRKLVDIATGAGDTFVVEWVSGKLLEQVKWSKQARDFVKYLEGLSKDELVELDRRLENNGGKI